MNIMIIVATFVGGWFAGHENSTIITECRKEPLIVSECVEIYPPQDNTFGATTASYIDLIGKYRKCRQSCINEGVK